jgi:Aspartyl/Asparaginyl beta-hydroxylase
MKAGPMPRGPRPLADMRSAPWWDPAGFPIVAALEAHAEDIRTELEDFVLSGALRFHPQSPGGPGKALTTGGWNIVELCSNGRVSARNAIHAPVTMSVLRSGPGVVTNQAGLAYFSVLPPHAHIKAHRGPTNKRLRIHLGLQVPPGCRMRVGHETRRWAGGRCLVFDDSWEHEVWNDSAAPRSILLLDIVHPDLPAASPAQRLPARAQVSQRAGWLPRELPAGRPSAWRFLDNTLALVEGSRAGRLRIAAAGTTAGRFAAGFPRPWAELGPVLARLTTRDAIDLVQVCAVLWQADFEHETVTREVLDRWPAPEVADLLRRLAALPDLTTRSEFLAAYEDQPLSPPFGATAPLLITATRQALRAGGGP